MWIFFASPQFSKLWSLTGCPNIQFTSDTTYLGLAQPSQIKGSDPQDDTNFRCRAQVPGLPYFCLTGYKLGVSVTQFLRVRNCQNGSQNSGKLFLNYYYPFSISNTTKDPLDGRGEQHKVWEG